MLKKILLTILILILLLAAGGYIYYRLKIYKPPLISDEDRAALRIMPLPAKLKIKSGSLLLSKNLEVEYTLGRNSIIEAGVGRFQKRLAARLDIDETNEKPVDLEIICTQTDEKKYPGEHEDESYKLVIDKAGIHLSSPTTFGMLHGLETILQIIDVDEESRAAIPYVVIEDKPRFAWRGLMLDVSRHWIPKEVVKRLLDGMSAAKLNVFHWHLSDDQGFRVESHVFPGLHEIGSNGKYYTQAEIREVIEYAGARGIRVVPEFDLPGHSLSWQIAYPELSSVNEELNFIPKKGAVFTPPLDPSKEGVYEFLDKFIAEMAELFPDLYFHIGGDEVNPAAWNVNLEITGFMKQNNIADALGLQAYFIGRVEKIITSHGKKMIGWDEILHPDMNDNTTVQCWRSQKSLFEAAHLGTNGILSAGYYLDHKLPAGKLYTIDPLVLPGAVDIVPDTANWKMYDLVMDVAGNKMKSMMVIFDRDSTNVFGYFAMLDNRTPFKDGTIQNSTLTFKFNSEVGELTYSARLLGDSLNGEIKFGMMSFGSYGSISGSSEMPGTAMPKIEIVKPLNVAETARVLGGEACMWAELVNEHNVESRVWPRAAVIAEKLWSPQEITTDTEDMYRRLAHFNTYLESRGSMHNSWYESGLSGIISAEGLPILKNLTDFLEEVKFVKRLIDMIDEEGLYLPDLQLDHLADIVYPESYPAYNFNTAVDEFLADPERKKNKEQILTMLSVWAENHEKLVPYFESNEKLMEIQHISAALAELASLALDKYNVKNIDAQDSDMLEQLALLENGENGVLCAVAPGIKKLLTAETVANITTKN